MAGSPRAPLALLAVVLPLALAADAGGSLIGPTSILAQVPDPGFPEGMVVDGERFWTTTPASTAFGVGVGPSTLFQFDAATGELLRTVVVQGEEPDSMRGLVGIAVDADHRLYVASLQHGILRFTPPAYEQEVYAAIPDLPACSPMLPIVCSPTLLDRAPFPNDMAFDAKGDLYVTDSFQATIWRIGGDRRVEPWFQSATFDGILGANGIRLDPARDTMYVATTLDPLHQTGVYALPFVDAPRAEDLKLVFASNDAPDGMAFGGSGNLYVTLAGSNQLLALSPDGVELARSPDALANLLADAPYDMPASVAFTEEGGRVLIANHALMDGHALPEHFTILQTIVDDKGDPLERPDLP